MMAKEITVQEKNIPPRVLMVDYEPDRTEVLQFLPPLFMSFYNAHPLHRPGGKSYLEGIDIGIAPYTIAISS
jgi:hypothetical protein